MADLKLVHSAEVYHNLAELIVGEEGNPFDAVIVRDWQQGE